jgi:large subunit ribosomal protein L10
MAKEKKAKIIDELQEMFSKSSVGVLTNYQKLPTSETDAIRKKLRAAGVDFKVVKNTLARRAASQAGLEKLGSSFEGPMAVVCGYGEVSDAPRVLLDHIRSTKTSVSIKGGFLGARVLSVAEIDMIAKLPSRNILLSMVLSGMKSPITSVVTVLAAPVRGLMGVMQARIKQLEGAK